MNGILLEFLAIFKNYVNYGITHISWGFCLKSYILLFLRMSRLRPLHNSFGHENAVPFVIPAKAGRWIHT
jgi:hypothetical protein